MAITYYYCFMFMDYKSSGVGAPMHLIIFDSIELVLVP